MSTKDSEPTARIVEVATFVNTTDAETNAKIAEAAAFVNTTDAETDAENAEHPEPRTESSYVSSNDEQSSVEPDKTEMTLEDVEKLSRWMTGRIRNEVLEYIHQHITDEEMGAMKDLIRGCIYAVLHGFFVTKAPREGLELWLEYDSLLHPIDVTAWELEAARGLIAEGRIMLPQGEQGEEQKQANARRQAAFSRKGSWETCSFCSFPPEED